MTPDSTSNAAPSRPRRLAWLVPVLAAALVAAAAGPSVAAESEAENEMRLYLEREVALSIGVFSPIRVRHGPVLEIALLRDEVEWDVYRRLMLGGLCTAVLEGRPVLRGVKEVRVQNTDMSQGWAFSGDAEECIALLRLPIDKAWQRLRLRTRPL